MSIATVLNNRIQKLKIKSLVKIKRKLNIIEPTTEYYIAYGGNINVERFKKMGFVIERIATVKIENYRLVFGMPCEYKGIGYATIEPDDKNAVYAVLYKCQKSLLNYLDVTEWVHWGYYRREKISIKTDSTVMQPWVYISVLKDYTLKPTRNYLNWIIKSAEENNFPSEYMQYLKSTESVEQTELDHDFNLTCPSSKRPKGFFNAYWIKHHDGIREWLCKII